MNAALATARNSIAMIFPRTIVHRVLLADFGRTASCEITVDRIAADLKLLRVRVSMDMVSHRHYALDATVLVLPTGV